MSTNIKITALPAEAAVLATDIIPCVVGIAAATPVTGKVTFTVVRNLLTGGLGAAFQILAMKDDGTGPEWHSYIGNAIAANLPTTGLVRSNGGDVVMGWDGVASRNGISYAPTNNWTFGNSSENSFMYGAAIQLLGIGGGVSVYDGRNGITTDLTQFAGFLSNSATTTLTAGTPTNLTFPIAANEIWSVDVDAIVTCNGVGGVAMGLDTPVGATVSGMVFGAGASAVAYTSAKMSAGSTGYGAFNTVNSAVGEAASMRAIVKNGATAGSITLRVYSVTAGQISTMSALSKMLAQRAVGF